MSIVTLDGKYRILLEKKVREKLGLRKGDKLILVILGNSIVLTPVKSGNYVGCLTGFNYQEEKHEASKYLFASQCQS